MKKTNGNLQFGLCDYRGMKSKHEHYNCSECDILINQEDTFVESKTLQSIEPVLMTAAEPSTS